MPDTKIDWAQELKRQMDQQDEPERRATQPPDEIQSELDALLREQLARMQQDGSNVPAPSAPRADSPLASPAAEDDPISEANVHTEVELTPDTEQESAVAEETPPAPDDQLNGVSVAELLNSGAFLKGLSPEISREIQSVWNTPPRAADAESCASPSNADTQATDTEPASAEAVPPEGAPEVASAETADGVRPSPQTTAPAESDFREQILPSSRDPLQIGLDKETRTARGASFNVGVAAQDTRHSDSRPAGMPRHTYAVRRSAPPHRTRNVGSPSAPGTSGTPTGSDAALYMDLGYETELRRTPGGSARADAVLRERLRAERVGTRNMRPAAYRGKEYSGSAMTGEVSRRYASANRFAQIRLIFAVIGCLLSILWDNLPYLLTPADPAFATGYLYPLVGIAIPVLFALPNFSRLGRGLRSVWDFEPVRYAVPALALLISSVHALLSLTAVGSGKSVPLFGGAAMLILALTSFCDLLAIRAEWRSFRIVSSGRVRTTVTVLASPDGRQDSRTDDMNPLTDLELPQDEETTGKQGARARRRQMPLTLRLCRTAHIPNFFALVSHYNSNLSHLNYLLPVAMLSAILVGGVSMLVGGNLLQDALPRFTATYLACLPGAFLLSVILPFAVGNHALCRKGCAMLGEETPHRYAPTSLHVRHAAAHAHGAMHTHLLLPDGFVLSPIQPNEITVRDDKRADEWLRMAHRLFALLDCPLAGFGDPPARSELDGIRIELDERGDEFLRLYMTEPRATDHSDHPGGTVEVMLGSYTALAARGVRLPPLAAEPSYKKLPDAQVLYLAFDRRFRLACASGLRIRPLFSGLVAQLESMGCRVSVLSYDPLAKLSPLFDGSEDSLHVGLCRPRHYSRLYAPRSGGLVSVHDDMSILYGYAVCRRIRTADRLGILLGWVWLLVACGLSVLLPLRGSQVDILPIACCLWQAVTAGLSCLPAWIAVRHHAPCTTKRKEDSSCP